MEKNNNFEKGDAMVWILNILLTRTETFLYDRKKQISDVLSLINWNEWNFSEILKWKERKNEELLKFISEIKEKILKLSYDDILKDLKDSEFCNDFIDRWFKESESSNIYNQISKIFIWWISNSKIFTKGEKSILFNELKIIRQLISIKKEWLLVPYIDKTLSVLNFLWLNIFSREILTTNSFRQYMSCKIDKEKWDYFLGMLDIDNFKSINDIFGHQVWDLVLKSIFAQLWEKVWTWFWFRYWWEEIWLIVNEEFLKLKNKTEFKINLKDCVNWQIDLVKSVQGLIADKLQDWEKVFFNNLSTLENQLKQDNFTKILDKKTEHQNLIWRYFQKNWEIINCAYVDRKRKISYHRHIKNDSLIITVSIGFSNLSEKDFQDTKQVNKKITEADIALYEAKKDWRNKIKMFK